MTTAQETPERSGLPELMLLALCPDRPYGQFPITDLSNTVGTNGYIRVLEGKRCYWLECPMLVTVAAELKVQSCVVGCCGYICMLGGRCEAWRASPCTHVGAP